jgi:prepilin-type N-terminal cleavage/methylation domain-containing protein
MIISTPRAERAAARAAFTLVEVMVAATIATIILAGVLSAFVLLGRTGFAASSYSEIEAETRRALDVFGDDARNAVDLDWHGAQSITLSVATAGSGVRRVTYAYDATPGSPTWQCFYRVAGEQDSPLPRLVLIRNVAGDFAFQRFKLEQPGVAENIAASDLETKQLQITLRSTRARANAAVAANQSALSARYILRNKRVSN